MTSHISDIEPKALAETKAGSIDARPTTAHVDAISQLFTELELAYHNQFHKAFPDNRSLQMAKQLWLTVLADIAPATIAAAGRQALCQSDFLPTLNTLREQCEAIILQDVPDVKIAFREACRAPEPKSRQAWSHPIVYLAGAASDWYFLKTQTEASTFPVYERHYRVLLDRMRKGEQLDLPVPPALEQLKPEPLSTDEQRKRMRALREQLDI